MTGGFKTIPAVSLARHLNHYFPQLEYSAQLVLQDQSQSQLEALQLQKVQLQLKGISDKAFKATLSPFNLKPSLLMLSLCLSVLLSGWLWSPQTKSSAIAVQSEISEVALVLESIDVVSRAPEYMQLPIDSLQSLNIETWQGAEIEWRLTFNRPEALLTLRLSGGESLVPQWQGSTAIFTTQVQQSQSYHLRLADEIFQQGFYSILVKADQKPDVRFSTDTASTMSFARQHTPVLDLTVQMRDDFALSDAKVRMSLARGTGEAVKFRDIERALSEFTVNTREQTLNLDWDLTQLGMEPGDELYLAVVAWDNKPVTAQEGKSSTIIVKWLDEEVEQVTAAGIVMDLELEYFKSQRQIIIETKQLIQDKQQLELAEFNETSRQLGLAQSDLKQRYGQYLGDEFEGAVMHAHSNTHQEHAEEEHSSPEEEGEHHADEHEHHEDEHHAPEPFIPGSAHDHHGGDSSHAETDLSGRMALINQFGHNHGEADIGPVLKFNPKAYMKRSVEQMWSAELHLMLGEPERALPFEEEALKYLKLARQADRIYVKRLGFEPPPVSEEKRLTGELDEVISAEKSLDFVLDDTSQQLLQDSYYLIASGRGRIGARDITKLNELRVWISNQITQRPALIRTQVQLETLLANQIWQPEVCTDCREKVQQKVWQLLSAPTPAAFSPGKHFLLNELRNQTGQEGRL
ncbi:hypothetical protein MACH26_14230 [Planctobacterium marinum]|uniref:Uncharacterized protein n=2 Tax=Planctobacterium marinum TaxID=1631968 RepID=A0AA48HLT3_9ALTE|nr:hypothetical protein MACH26_14230 [Planctobacterium marinum]